MNSYGVRPRSVFEAPGEVVGVDEVGEVASQLLMRLVEVAFDGCVLDGAVHSFDLPVGPGMLGFGQAMVDIALGAGVFEGVRPDGLSGVEGGLDVGRRRTRVAWRREGRAVVGEDRVGL